MDERRVPHIFAENSEDAFFAQGYITAYNRLWQMDMSTRKVSGRLAEVVGERALASDLLQRRKGIVKAAEEALKVWREGLMLSADNETLQGTLKRLRVKP